MNPYEEAARAKKVAALLKVIPVGTTAKEITFIADWAAALSPEDRAHVATLAGVNPPSDATWAEVVKQARARRVIEDIFARASTPSNDNGSNHRASKETLR